MKRVLIFVFAISLFGCSNVEKKEEPLDVINYSDYDYRVKLLFEVDGVKVYRFNDGRVVYFTNGNGQTDYRSTRLVGKVTHTEEQTTLCNSTPKDSVVLREYWVSDTTHYSDGRILIMKHKEFEVVE